MKLIGPPMPPTLPCLSLHQYPTPPRRFGPVAMRMNNHFMLIAAIANSPAPRVVSLFSCGGGRIGLLDDVDNAT